MAISHSSVCCQCRKILKTLMNTTHKRRTEHFRVLVFRKTNQIIIVINIICMFIYAGFFVWGYLIVTKWKWSTRLKKLGSFIEMKLGFRSAFSCTDHINSLRIIAMFAVQTLTPPAFNSFEEIFDSVKVYGTWSALRRTSISEKLIATIVRMPYLRISATQLRKFDFYLVKRSTEHSRLQAVKCTLIIVI